ncbi:MAG TPA: thioredoxin family protein, partial [Bacteroidota bacterium]|nr:thioredoxin family protein [Bacteroidota bacterium]
LQKSMTARGAVWLSICSSAPGKQGYYEGTALKEKLKEEHASPTAYLVDPDGTVGRLYGAKTTPHMFIIDPKGVLIYEGGIDNIPSTDTEDIARATNYVKEVMAAAWDGKPLPVKATRSYGCSVKYR